MSDTITINTDEPLSDEARAAVMTAFLFSALAHIKEFRGVTMNDMFLPWEYINANAHKKFTLKSDDHGIKFSIDKPEG